MKRTKAGWFNLVVMIFCLPFMIWAVFYLALTDVETFLLSFASGVIFMLVIFDLLFVRKFAKKDNV